MRAQEAKRRAEPMPPHQPSPYYVSQGSGPGSTTGDWKCANCGNINFAFREKCNRCNTPRPGAKLFGPMTQNERRICPFTVMLMRVPSHATELQVADALLTFGELEAPDRADGVEQVVLPSGQVRDRATDARVLV